MLDDKSIECHIALVDRLDPGAARKLIRQILNSGVVVYSQPHAIDRLKKHGMTTMDCENALRGGTVDEPEYENGDWQLSRPHAKVRGHRLVVVGVGVDDRHRVEAAMKCPQCRQAEVEIRHENRRFEESGLPNVVLENVEVRHCPACGADMLAIPRMAQLHRTLAVVLITKLARLMPAEIRYLRKSLGWSQKDFATALHVDPSTANRWEKDHGSQRMELGYELALRLAVAVGKQIDEYKVERLGEVAVGEPKAVRITLRDSKNGWQREAAA